MTPEYKKELIRIFNHDIKTCKICTVHLLAENNKIAKIQKQLKENKKSAYDYEKIWEKFEQLLSRGEPGLRVDVSFSNSLIHNCYLQ